MTERAEFVFKVKEFSSGVPWIAAEPLSEELRGVRGLLGFDLMPGTTFDQAKEIAAYMEKHIKSITLTP